jgi:hypothetical protein
MSDALDAVLVLYHHYRAPNAPTILEHAGSFERHSRFPVFSVNTDGGYPRALDDLSFKAVVLHYSLFPGPRYFVDSRFLRFLARSTDAHTVAFFQDDYRYCAQRFAFIDEYAIDTVCTLLPDPYTNDVYGRRTNAKDVQTTLTGYVSDDLIDASKRLTVPFDQRSIDVGYRARRLHYSLGRAGQEKSEIAERFLERSTGRGLRLDIATGEDSRLYGRSWYEFVASCRGMLGVEAGVSIFDFDDSARRRTDALLAREPNLSYDEVEARVLGEYEGNIPYRVLSPRHFEAAAFRVVQILYEGHYSGVLEPDVHYLALAKDFSNFDDVMARFADPVVRREVTDRAYDDLIASGNYSYASFVDGIDEQLAAHGLEPGRVDDAKRVEIAVRLERRHVLSRALARGRYLRTRPFPGRRFVAPAYKRVRRAVVKVR